MYKRIIYVSFLLVAISGCVPVTQYVRSANVPSATGETLTLPMHNTVEMSGSFSYNDSFNAAYYHLPSTLVYDVNDPLVLQSTVHLEGLVRISVHSNVAIGAHGTIDLFRVGDYLHLPFDNTPSVGVGPNVAFHFHPGSENFTIGMSGALTFASIPWNSWALQNPQAAGRRTSVFDPSLYYRRESSSDILYLYRASVGVSYLFAGHIEPFGGISMQNEATNIGFDNVNRGGSTLSARDLNIVPYVGVSANLWPVFVRFQCYLPLNVTRSAQGEFGTQLQVGAGF